MAGALASASLAEEHPPSRPRNTPRGARGGVASRMSGSEKRRAKKERERLVMPGLLADDEHEGQLDSEEEEEEEE